MTTPIPPSTDPIFDAAAHLLACLTVECEALASPPTNVMFMPGGQLLEDLSMYNDLCCSGTAYVRHASTYPSGESWPSPDAGQNNCSPIAWGTIFEIGIMRCAPTGSIEFAPTPTNWFNANSQYFIDSAALRATICRYKNMYAQGYLDSGVMIGQAGPVGPQGGCLVATLSVQIQVIATGGC